MVLIPIEKYKLLQTENKNCQPVQESKPEIPPCPLKESPPTVSQSSQTDELHRQHIEEQPKRRKVTRHHWIKL